MRAQLDVLSRHRKNYAASRIFPGTEIACVTGMPNDVVMHLHVAGRLLFAALAGAAVGFNRELAGKPAGLRTHALVALGAAGMSAISVTLGDPSSSSRVAQGIVAGVGFIGGGVILHNSQGVQGLTTASSIWVVAAVGVAAGLGLWGLATTIAGLALVVLVGGEFVDELIRRWRR